MIWFNKFLESQGCKGAVSSRPECRAVLDDALVWVGEIGVMTMHTLLDLPCQVTQLGSLQSIISIAGFLLVITELSCFYMAIIPF
ncbi:hypothetical protein NC652_029899 [Populus alba x Populus x berolinensis]|nr:hypothetical protein NC652_029899 [Populus alba x Populus x berolinensis]